MPITLQGIDFEITGTLNSRTASNIDKVTNSLKNLKSTMSNAKLGSAYKEAGALGGTGSDSERASGTGEGSGGNGSAKRMSSLLSSLKESKKEFKSAGQAANEFYNSLKRIAMYRMLRTALKLIASGVKEGVNNIYQFSKAGGDFGVFAQSMDTIATSFQYLKNSVGAAISPIINALAPAIDWLIDKFVALLNVINQVIAILTGAGSWNKALKYPKEYAAAAGSATGKVKELQKTILGFDEINKLNGQNNTGAGGGAGGLDYSKMFENVDFNKRLQDLIGKMKINFNDVLFKWDNLTPEDIAKKAIAGLSAFLGGAAGFIIGGVPGAVVGTLIGGTMGLVIDSIIFDNDGQLSRNEVGEMLRLALFTLAGGAIGFVVGGPGGALIGASVGMTLYGAIKGFDFLNGGTKGEDLLRELVPLLGTIGGALIGFKLGGGVGAVIGATIGLTIGFGIEDFGFSDTSKWTATDWIENIIHTFAPVTGTLIGFAVGGPGGAAIGALIGLGISFALKTEPKMDGENLIGGFWDGVKDKWNQFTRWLDREWDDLKNWWRNLELPTFKIKKPHLSWSTQSAGGWMANILSALGLPASLPKLNVSWYAQGGFPNAGQLFVANEAGAEMVGSMGGRTAVANNQQIVEGIRQGVRDANSDEVRLLREQNDLLRAILEKEGNVEIPLSTITNAMARKNQRDGGTFVPVG